MKVNTHVYKLNTTTGEISEPLLIEHIEDIFLGFLVRVDGEEHTVYKSNYKIDRSPPEFMILTEAALRKYEQQVTLKMSELCHLKIKFLIDKICENDRQQLSKHLNELNTFLSERVDSIDEKKKFPFYASMWGVKELNESEIRNKLINTKLQTISFRGICSVS